MIEIIDNFLKQEDFDSLTFLYDENNFMTNERLDWSVQKNVTIPQKNDNLSMFTHIFYSNTIVNEGKGISGIGHPCSSHVDKIIPILEKLNIKSMIRAKANLYPYSGKTLYEHEMHIDYEFPHYAALLSLNTCDGYTKLEDGTKIESVANRIVIFDASQKHCSTTTTSDFARINININYL